MNEDYGTIIGEVMTLISREIAKQQEKIFLLSNELHTTADAIYARLNVIEEELQ